MKTCGLFTTHQVTVKTRNGERWKLIPFGDVHRDSELHCRKYWKEFLDYAKQQKNALFIGIGDYCDMASTTERTILGDGGLHESTKRTLETVSMAIVKNLAKELAFMKGRLLGLLGGNHYIQFQDGSTSDHLLADYLGTRFLGVCSFVRITFHIKGTSSTSVDIFAHHGKGGGSLPGSTFNTLERMLAGVDADIYLSGHDHKRGAIPSTPRLRLVHSEKGLSVKQRIPWLGRTGSFLKAYEDGHVSYNVDANRPPCALGWIEFDLMPTRVREDGQNYSEVRIRGIS